MHWYSEREKVFKECPKLVVLWLVSRDGLAREFHRLGQSRETTQRPHVLNMN